MITFVIVSYNTRAHLERCLTTLRDHPVIVVDNASTDGSADLATIRNKENLGFGAAANRGITAAGTAWTFLLNPDVELLPNTLPPLLAAADANPRAGIIGPAHLSASGGRQRSDFPNPAVWRAVLRHFLFAETIAARLPSPIGRGAGGEEESKVHWLLGAALLIRRECFDQIGGFDESIFLYGEDWDFCYRAQKAAWDVLYVPQSQVVHHGNAAAASFGADRLARVTLSELRVIEKNYGARTAKIHRALALMGSTLRAPFSEKHRRVLRALWNK